MGSVTSSFELWKKAEARAREAEAAVSDQGPAFLQLPGARFAIERAIARRSHATALLRPVLDELRRVQGLTPATASLDF